MKLSIIIPAYNEARTIHFILDKVLDVQLINNIEKEITINKSDLVGGLFTPESDLYNHFSSQFGSGIQLTVDKLR